MSELCFKIVMSGILGCLLSMTVGFGIYLVVDADDWKDRLAGALIIPFGILAGFLIVCIWSTDISGLK